MFKFSEQISIKFGLDVIDGLKEHIAFLLLLFLLDVDGVAGESQLTNKLALNHDSVIFSEHGFFLVYIIFIINLIKSNISNDLNYYKCLF